MSGVVVSPILLFNDAGLTFNKGLNLRYMLLFKNKNRIKEYLRDRICYDYIVPTPGRFFSKELVNKQYIDLLNEY